jgi:hypothetical protein
VTSLDASRTTSPATAKPEVLHPPTPPIPTTAQMARRFFFLAADADWDGNAPLASRYRTIAETYRKRHEEGDLYDPPF